MNRLFITIIGILIPFGLTFSAERPAGRVVIWESQPNHPSFPFQPTGVLQVHGADVTNAVALAAGVAHGLALLADGSVVGFGNNEKGQSFAGEGQVFGWRTVSNTTKLRMEASFVKKGVEFVVVDGKRLSAVTEISTGPDHSLALREDGTVVGWGLLENERYTVSSQISNVVHLACGWDTDWFALLDGGVVGLRSGGLHPMAGQLSNVVSITANWNARSLFVAQQRDGVLYSGSIVQPIRLFSDQKAKAIGGGGWQILTVGEDGRVTPTGVSATEPPGDLTNAVAVATATHKSMALRSNGTVVMWGNPRQIQPRVPPGLSNVVAIAVGEGFAAAITTNAEVADRLRNYRPWQQ